MQPLQSDIPYPSLDGITEDNASARIIAPEYASLSGELSATLQYIYHSFIFKKLDMKSYADILERIAISEMHHLELLGTMLIKLGCDPIYTALPPYRTKFFNTSLIAFSKTPQNMLLDDISDELRAIDSYNTIAKRLDNEQVAAVVRRIIIDEETHLAALKELYDKLYI